MLVPWKDMNGRHVTTAQCAKEAEQKRRRMAEKEMRKSTERDFQACGRPAAGLRQACSRTLVTVTLFKYLGQVLTAADDDWPFLVGNLRKAQKS